MLDVGSGLGGTCVYVAKKYDIQCTGITISPNQVKYAQDYAATEGVENKVYIYIYISLQIFQDSKVFFFFFFFSLFNEFYIFTHKQLNFFEI